jgi:hypothetical protein
MDAHLIAAFAESVAGLSQRRGGSEPSARTCPRQRPQLSTLNNWYRALEGAGVEFIDDDAERGLGVRLRHSGKSAGKRK